MIKESNVNNFEFKQFYENHEVLKQVRDQKSVHYFEYLDIVKNWKIKYLAKLVAKCNNINTILEVGCATGELLNYFVPKTFFKGKKIGLDISENNIKIAKERYPDIEFNAIKFEDFTFKNKEIYFDLIILSDILEHVDNDLELLKLAAQRSKFILINLPLEKCWEYKNREYGPFDHRGHLRAYNLLDAKKLVKNANLIEINSYVKYYVKEPVFRRFLWRKLSSLNKSGLYILLKYLLELIEIFFRYPRYKSNYFALLKPDII